MADNGKGSCTAGFSLLWRRQEVLWWVFAVNFICGALGTAPAALTLNRALHHSLAGEPLSKGFDLGMFFELLRLPNVGLIRSTTSSYIFAFLFFLFHAVRQRRDSRDLSSRPQAYDRRFLCRLRRVFLAIRAADAAVPCPVFRGEHDLPGSDKLSDYVGDKAIADQVGIFLGWAAIVVFLLLALGVRLWFDVAQVRAVARNERGMWRNLWSACRITWGNLGSLFWMYFRISLVAWVTLVLGLVIWAHLPPTATPVTFVLLELILLAQLVARLWQLASATTWYQRHVEGFLPSRVDLHDAAAGRGD